ncbi:uncharacterized protein At4g18490 [Juglans microcarpa x Juglans regia]|uniref:uncharacterized protein At4g18490 n=1 Tax=Juglans microcarpa x Juglans regia TaxID=2249226 RepID=UPI001B7DCC76|nr:uncharacterized protein At4g18490 [Juglans microcarpa x Juglans regia]XP_041027504.1 uncharacterized protein At4g18490 [Juglans microcarpa x Juglans regia]XP_041027506.1 uncharacterized protein At4g18490 [Juglans microcarpa x Juglans regia]
MAEAQMGMSSIDPKEKSSLLDEEIGKEFLTSWKSMSVTEDDAMDFSFDTVAKGKKKTFNFENLDMDFNLDGDFDKLSSFKVDISDLDFSCPPKKTAKPKESSEAEFTSGNFQGKKGFDFCFDFNELGGFNFESNILKEDKNSQKTSERKGVASELSQCQGSKLKLSEDNAACDDSLSMKLPACKTVVTSKVETSIVVQGDLNSSNDHSTFENLPVSHGQGTSTLQTTLRSTEDTDQENCLSEKSTFADPYPQQVKPDLPIQSVCANYPNQDTISDALEVDTKVCPLGTKEENAASGEQIDVDEMTVSVRSDHEKSPYKISSLVFITGSDRDDGERNKSDGLAPIKNMDDTEPAERDLDMKDNSLTNVSRKNPHDTNGIWQNQSSRLHLAPLCREPVVNTRMLEKEKEGSIHSKFYTRPEETGSQLYQLSGTKLPAFGRKRVGAMHVCPIGEKRKDFNVNDAQTASKLAGGTISVAREVTKGQPVFLRSEKNVKHIIKIREGLNSDIIPHVGKLIENSQPHDKEVTEGEPVLIGSEKNVKDHHTLSLTEKTTECSAPARVNLKLVVSSMESLRNSKIISAEKNKVCPIKAGKKMPDLSHMKTSRTLGAKQVLSNSTREVSSLGKLEENRKVQSNTELKTEHPVDSNEKQMSQNLSLKRKTFEGSNSDSGSLKPLKRLSESPSESSNFKVPAERILEEQVCIHGIQGESTAKHVVYDHLTSGLESHRVANMMDLEIPLVMETDGNVEKAEAYAKELDDICNMLKKKHEEAKEILVRAIVNNNNLLMLNHPIHEEKIRKIQNFAARLMSKELQT